MLHFARTPRWNPPPAAHVGLRRSIGEREPRFLLYHAGHGVPASMPPAGRHRRRHREDARTGATLWIPSSQKKKK
jgi:hypothetical protein